jgi:hypothetical protein
VTRDYGSQTVLEATTDDPPATETVIRFLDREAEIETRYGGGFVQSIEGVSGEVRERRSSDWFFFVNGVESSVGAGDAEVRGGDVIWWDYRDWTDAMRTPAVVGSWPEPFAQASAGEERVPVRIECAAPTALCEATSERLAEAGVEADLARAGGPEPAEPAALESPRILVGTWARLSDDPTATVLDEGPAHSGVFAAFAAVPGGHRFSALDQSADPVRRLSPGAGLVAALREGERPPTWVVTGTARRGVERAVSLLDREHLADRYAVAVDGTGQYRLPVIEAGP